MASSSFSPSVATPNIHIRLLLLVALLAFPTAILAGHLEETSLRLATESLEWPMSMYGGELEEDDDDDGEEVGDEEETGSGRRSLFWKRMRYYISYGALSANRVPCPPRSGRPYYTHNCFRASGPVRPYNRGCSRITLCRR